MQKRRCLSWQLRAEDEGKRVDTLLRHALSLSSGAVRRAKRIPEGICLDGVAVYTNACGKAGQVLSVLVGDGERKGDDLPLFGVFGIAYEDEDLLLVEKPAPLAVHPAPGQQGDSLLNYLLYHYETIGLQADVHVVNRLDRGTSGLMAVAKHAHAHERLASQLHSVDFSRLYLAVCEGRPSPPQGVIDAPIERAEGEVLRRCVRPDGASARTHYETLQSKNGRSLLRLRLETGRTHQIRVHLAHLGCPIVGDFLYGQECPDLPRRFALHAAEISLLHPITGERLHKISPLPADLEALLQDPPAPKK